MNEAEVLGIGHTHQRAARSLWGKMLNQYISLTLFAFFLSLLVLAAVIGLDLNIFRFKLWVLERDMEPIGFLSTPPSTPCCILCRVLSLWWEMETRA